MAVPYLIAANSPSSLASQAFLTTNGSNAGDCLIVGMSNTSAAGATITGVSDTKGNAYTRIGSANSSNQFGDWWISPNAAALLSGDTITVTFSSTSGVKNCLLIGVPGVVAVSPVDQNPAWFHSGSSAAPTVTTGTLAQASEIAIGIINNANAGGSPTLGNGFTSIGQVHLAGDSWTTMAYLNLSSTAAVTFSATITASTVALNVVTLKLLTAAGVPAQAPYMPPRRRLARAVVQFTPVTTTNAPPVAGTVQPRATVPVPRRRLARALWRGITGPSIVRSPPVLQPRPAPRRVPARAYVRFTPVVTVNAVPAPPVAGTVQPRATVPVPRRRLARAVVQFTPVTTVNVVPPAGTVQPRATLVPPRRQLARAYVRFTVTPPAPAPPPPATAAGVSFPGDDKRLIRRRELRILGMRL